MSQGTPPVLTADSRHRNTFTRIITADCFWMPDQHVPLVRTISRMLEHSSSARVFVIAGFHTGRFILANFFCIAASEGLIPDEEDIMEYNVTTQKTRPWKEDRIDEDVIERKQWLVVALLRWRNLISS